MSELLFSVAEPALHLAKDLPVHYHLNIVVTLKDPLVVRTEKTLRLQSEIMLHMKKNH